MHKTHAHAKKDKPERPHAALLTRVHTKETWARIQLLRHKLMEEHLTAHITHVKLSCPQMHHSAKELWLLNNGSVVFLHSGPQNFRYTCNINNILLDDVEIALIRIQATIIITVRVLYNYYY